MKYKTLGLIFLLLWGCNSQNNKSVDNESNSTDSVVKEFSEMPQTKKWEIENFVDEFGDTLNEKFVLTTTSGNYSYIPYTNKFPAKVVVIIKKSNIVGIFFYDEIRNLEPMFVDFTSGTLKAKNSEGKLFNCSVYEKWSGRGLRINNARLKSFILDSHGIMKIVIQENDIRQFNFEFDLTDLNAQIALI